MLLVKRSKCDKSFDLAKSKQVGMLGLSVTNWEVTIIDRGF